MNQLWDNPKNAFEDEFSKTEKIKYDDYQKSDLSGDEDNCKKMNVQNIEKDEMELKKLERFFEDSPKKQGVLE